MAQQQQQADQQPSAIPPSTTPSARPSTTATMANSPRGSSPSSKHEKVVEMAADDAKAEKAAPPSTPAPPGPPSPPPNGGLTAWLQVSGGFMLFFNTWGFLNTFGVFQTYYESGALFEASSSEIAWIGSIQSFMLLTVGFVTGPFYDRGHLRLLVATGSALIVFGLMMLSLCTTFWQALLAQGFTIGIGAGCLFVPTVAVLPTYFTTRLGLAVGVAVGGSALGGIIYPVVLYRLLDPLGFGWAVRVLGFLALATLAVPVAVMRQRIKPPRARALWDSAAFADWQWLLFTAATFVGFVGLAISIIYISYFGYGRGLADEALAFYIVPIFNAASLFGRVLPNALSDRTGPFNVIFPGTLIFGVLALCMRAVRSTGAYVAVGGVLIGFISGLYIALPPLCFVALTPDKSKLGTRMGMSYSIVAAAMLIGGPGAGGVLGRTDPQDWDGLWTFAGVMCLASGLMYGAIRVGRHGWKLKVKG